MATVPPRWVERIGVVGLDYDVARQRNVGGNMGKVYEPPDVTIFTD